MAAAAGELAQVQARVAEARSLLEERAAARRRREAAAAEAERCESRSESTATVDDPC